MRVTANYTIEADLYDAFRAQAKRQGVAMSYLIGLWVSRWLEKAKDLEVQAEPSQARITCEKCNAEYSSLLPACPGCRHINGG